MPPKNEPDAGVQLAVAVREAALRIESLQEEVKQIRELRKVATRTERVLATYEAKFDGLVEKLDREISILQDALKTSNKTTAMSRQSCQEGFNRDIAALKDRMDKREKEAATSKRLTVTAIVGIATSLIAATAAIIVALIKTSGG